MAAYSYTPLHEGHFRLLKLFPGEETAQLEGNLIVRRLRPKFAFTVDTPAFKSPRRSQDPPVIPQIDTGDGNLKPEMPVVDFAAEEYDALSYTWGGEPDPTLSITIIDRDQAHKIPITANLKSALQHLRYRSNARFLWVDAVCINQDDKVEKGHQILKMFEIYNQAKMVCVWLGVEENHSGEALRFIRRILNFAEFDQLVNNSLTSKEWAAFLALMKRPWFSRRW